MPFEFVVGPDPDEHPHPGPGTNLPTVAKPLATPKPMQYVSLHHHSTFSYLDGYQMPEAHVRRAAELGMTSLALTEHGNISSHVKLEMACENYNIKPIYGCEVYTGAVGEERTQRKNHLTLLAENQDGYKNLLRTVTQGWEDFYYEPTVSGSNLARHNAGLIALSGCTGSLLSTSLVGGKNVPPEDASFKRGYDVAQRFKATFGNRYYLEVQAFPELANVCKLNVMLAELSAKLGIPLVATGDVHYTTPEESEVQQILHNIRGGNRQTLEQQSQSWGYDVPLSPPVSDAHMLERLIATGLTRKQAAAAVAATAEIADRCNVALPKMPLLRFPSLDGATTLETWHQWLRQGWRKRGFHKLSPEKARAYRQALRTEMDVIEAKDFIDYFLIVSDIVIYAKEHGIPVGPARGSAAASLVCYLLRITEVDPLAFSNLVFERFIDVTREDLPDIDLDFDSNRRDEIRQYAERRYGQDCVANIGTFNFFKSKNSLDDVARVYRVPAYKIKAVKEVLVERSSGDLRASATIEETVELFDQAKQVFADHPEMAHAMALEGNVKGMGVHAAGLLISNQPITDVTAIYRREVNGITHEVVGIDKYDVERQGLIKIDVLGLSTMSVIAEALQLINMPLDDLYTKIKFDDPKVLQAFHVNDCVGIFQFDGQSMASITQSLKPDNFDEICDINALARPGPLHSGSTGRYIDAKHGRIKVEPLHPLLENITAHTHHQIVYQEQILRIVREVGNFDWTHASYIRKIISKKLGEQEFERQYQPFKKGAIANGVSPEVSREIWNNCITAGTYAFNRAHCVSYGMLAFWTMWLKVYFPAEFYAACLNNLNSDKTIPLLKDARAHGIAINPPTPSGGVAWAVGPQGGLHGGFSQISGIGPKTGALMVAHAASQPVKAWSDFQIIRGIGPSTIAKITEFANSPDPYKIDWLKNRISGVVDQLDDFNMPKPIQSSSLEIPYEIGKDIRVRWAGVVTKRNQKDLYEMHFSRNAEELNPDDVKDPHLREWVVMWAKDDDDFVTASVNRWRYSKFRKAIWNIKIDKDVVLFEGIKPGWRGQRAINVNKMWVIDPD